jgi:carboxypeptidase PM20D1
MTVGTVLASIGIGLGVLLIFLAGFIVLKTVLYSPPQKKADKKDFVKVDGKNVAERLGLAVQCKTVSYHDAEKVDTNTFVALHRLFQTLYPQVHAKLKRELVNDYSLLYTWEGKDPSLKPIMLTSHLDVVPADESPEGGWTHPPFAGEIADGYVWGRGTLDIKSGVIGVLEAVEYLLKQGFQPERTVYLGFGHDEEIGGEQGARAIAELLDSRGVQLASLLDEGGSVIENYLPGVERQVGVIGISEKGYVSLRLTVEMDGGHSSMPPEETAIGVLSRAVASLELNPMPPHLEVVEFLMSYLGSALPFGQRMLFANTWLFGGILKKKLSEANMLNATIRTTTAPTIFHSGMKDNVLPAKAEAVVNFRILPGDDLRSVYEMVLERINDERVKVTPYLGETLGGESGWDPSPVADTDSPYYLRLARLTKEAFPGAMVAPYLVLGGTDARHYARVTRNALRFTPILMSKEDVGTVHGVNEKLSIDECSRMVGFYIAYIEEIANLSGELDVEPEPEEELIEEELDALDEEEAEDEAA